MKHRLLWTVFALALLLSGLVSMTRSASAASVVSKPSSPLVYTTVIGHIINGHTVLNPGVHMPLTGLAPSPNISRVDCVGNNFFKMYTDFSADIICFANAGTQSVNILNTTDIYTGNNTGAITWDDGVTVRVTIFFVKFKDYSALDISGGTLFSIHHISVVQIF